MALDTIFHIRYTIVINTIVQQLNFLHQLNIDVKENYEYDNDIMPRMMESILNIDLKNQ